MAGLFGAPAIPLAAQPTLIDFPDVDLVSPPPESISSIAFSPVADLLAVGSWGPDVRSLTLVALAAYLLHMGRRGRWFLILFLWGVLLFQVRIYDVGPQGQSQGKALASHPGTVLDLCWNKVGNFIFLIFCYELASASPEEQSRVCVFACVGAQRAVPRSNSRSENSARRSFFFPSRVQPPPRLRVLKNQILIACFSIIIFSPTTAPSRITCCVIA